jgi:hypothetical protein
MVSIVWLVLAVGIGIIGGPFGWVAGAALLLVMGKFDGVV